MIRLNLLRIYQPGQYEIRVDIESAGCGGMAEQLSQTWTVTINDPAIAPDIVVADGKTDLCEGGEVRFRNNTTAGHAAALRFEWTVKKNGGAAREGVDYQFTGSTNAHSKEPVLKFLTYGDYTVEVLAAVECNGENREFHFHVKKHLKLCILRFRKWSVRLMCCCCAEWWSTIGLTMRKNN